MKTLTEHFIEQYTKNYGNKSDAQWDAEKKAVKAWLTEHKNDIGNQIYSDHRVVAETVFDVLLEELNQK